MCPVLIWTVNGLCMLPQFLFINTCFNPVEVEGFVCLCVGRDMWVSSSSFTWFCESWGKVFDGDLPFSIISRSLNLCILSGCELLYFFSLPVQEEYPLIDLCIFDLFICCIVECHLGAIFFLFFRTKNSVWFYLQSLDCLLSCSLSPKHCELLISSHGVSLNSHQILDYYLHKLCATIILTYFIGWTPM